MMNGLGRMRAWLQGVTCGLVLVTWVSGLGWWAVTASAIDPATVAKYYVSIGDSYAAGYRPTGSSPGATSRDGFPYQVEAALREHGSRWELVNFACSGETAYAMGFEKGCEADARAPGGVDYPDAPQAVAAADFIARHRDRIGLVTVVMGGNDVLRCLQLADAPDAQACAEEEIPKVTLSLDAVLARARSAVGPNVPIIGVSYINVFAADILKDDADGAARAEFALALFENYVNPALLQTYSKYGARFVDTTALAGGYLPHTDKAWLPGYGTVTASIGRICALSYYCSDDDPHPNRAGHAMIAAQIEKLVRA
jgi:lysophospholipase L1-like esterase